MSEATINVAGAGRTRTAPARAPDGFPFGFRRYRSYTLFAMTDGVVEFQTKRHNKTFVSVRPE